MEQSHYSGYPKFYHSKSGLFEDQISNGLVFKGWAITFRYSYGPYQGTALLTFGLKNVKITVL